MNSITSAFLRAIRVHVIGVRHCGILLAHYGRLDSTFDTCVKTVVDVLREEGMLNAKSEVVVSVGLQALREVIHLYLCHTTSTHCATYSHSRSTWMALK
jgi:cohesin complex subunit SA-1/2